MIPSGSDAQRGTSTKLSATTLGDVAHSTWLAYQTCRVPVFRPTVKHKIRQNKKKFSREELSITGGETRGHPYRVPVNYKNTLLEPKFFFL